MSLSKLTSESDKSREIKGTYQVPDPVKPFIFLGVSSTDAACIEEAKQASKMLLTTFVNFIRERYENKGQKKRGPLFK